MSNRSKLLWLILAMLLVVAGWKVYERITYSKLQPAPYANVPWDAFKAMIADSLGHSHSLKDSLLVINGFAHTTFRAGNKDSYLEINDELRQWSAEQWYHAFRRDSFSGSCDHAARYAKALYQVFGFQSFLVTIAKRDWSDGKGHITNIVARQNSACPELSELYWMDAFFNTHFEKRDGSLLTLQGYFNGFESGQTGQFRIVEASKKAKYLQDYNRYDETDMYKAGPNCRIYRSKNPQAKYSVECPRTLANYLEKGFAGDFADIAHDYGFALDFADVQDFKYAFLLVRDVGGEIMAVQKDACRQELLDAIRQRSKRVTLND